MNQRSEDIETAPHDLGAYPSQPRASTRVGTLASSAANFFRGPDRASRSLPPRRVLLPSAEAEARRAALQAVLFRHWSAVKADGITASEFVAFLQPLADLDGITVSYICGNGDDTEDVQEGSIWNERNFIEPEDMVRDR